MSTRIIIRIEPQLKDRVSRLARAEGKTTREVVRELLEEYVAGRDIAAAVDGLWDRIGGAWSARVSRAKGRNVPSARSDAA